MGHDAQIACQRAGISEMVIHDESADRREQQSSHHSALNQHYTSRAWEDQAWFQHMQTNVNSDFTLLIFAKATSICIREIHSLLISS